MLKFPLRRKRRSAEAAETSAERRRHLRHNVSVPVIVDADDGRYECEISNVGSGGAYLVPRLELPVGRQVKVRPRDGRVCATAGVRRVDLAGFGIQFDDQTLGAIVAGWSRRVCNA